MMPPTIIAVRHKPVAKREPSYLSPWMVRLDVDRRWRRVRTHGGAQRQALYLHFGPYTLFLVDANATEPKVGDTFTWKAPD